MRLYATVALVSVVTASSVQADGDVDASRPRQLPASWTADARPVPDNHVPAAVRVAPEQVVVVPHRTHATPVRHKRRFWSRMRSLFVGHRDLRTPVRVGETIYEPALRDIRLLPVEPTLPGRNAGIVETLPVLPPRENGYFLLPRQ